MKITGNKFNTQPLETPSPANPADRATTITYDASPTASLDDTAIETPALPATRPTTRFEVEKPILPELGVNDRVLGDDGTSLKEKPAAPTNGAAISPTNGTIHPVKNGAAGPISINGAPPPPINGSESPQAIGNIPPPKYASVLEKLRRAYNINTVDIIKVNLTDPEIDVCKELFQEYKRNMHLVDFAIDQALLFYVDLIDYQAKFRGISKINYDDEDERNDSICFKYLTNIEFVNSLPFKRSDETIFRIKKQDLGCAMEKASIALNNFIFSKEALDKLSILANLSTIIPEGRKREFGELGAKNLKSISNLIMIVSQEVLGTTYLFKWDFINLHLRYKLDAFLSRPKKISQEAFFKRNDIPLRRPKRPTNNEPENICLEVRALEHFFEDRIEGKTLQDISISEEEYLIMSPIYGRLQQLAIRIQNSDFGFYYGSDDYSAAKSSYNVTKHTI